MKIKTNNEEELKNLCDKLYKFFNKKNIIFLKKIIDKILVRVNLSVENNQILTKNIKFYKILAKEREEDCEENTDFYKTLVRKNREKIEEIVYKITKILHRKFLDSNYHTKNQKIGENFDIIISQNSVKINFSVTSPCYEAKPLKLQVLLSNLEKREIFEEVKKYKNNILGKSYTCNCISLRFIRYKGTECSQRFLIYTDLNKNTIKDKIHNYYENLRESEITILHPSIEKSKILLNFENYFARLVLLNKDIKDINMIKNEFMIDFQCNFIEEYFRLYIYEKSFIETIHSSSEFFQYPQKTRKNIFSFLRNIKQIANINFYFF